MSLLRVVLFSIALLGINGCSSVQYYSQSVGGHLDVWWPQQPIEEILKDESQPTELKQQLELALRARRFASSHLALPDNDSYTSYTDLGRSHVVWNVVAAKEFSLKAKTWCYLVVGCLSYRGYFSQTDAAQHAAKLQQQGYDVSVGGVSAYSTLGWFDDPVLNTMIHWPERALVGLIFHELAHQVVYIPNETAFNEAFASAVARLGMIRWYEQNKPEAIDDYLAFLQQQTEFRSLLLQTRNKLEQLYAKSINEEQKRQQKAQFFTELKNNYELSKTNWRFPTAFDKWFDRPLNNARLVASMTYLEKIPAFYALFQQANGDWPGFYEKIRELEELDHDQREAKVQQLLDQQMTLQQALVKTI